MVLQHPIFDNKAKVFLPILLVLLSIVTGVAVAFLSLKKLLILLALIVGVILVFLCVTNYKLGYSIALASGFSIFILSRYFMDAFPVGWIVEILIYSSFLGLMAHCLIRGESLFDSLYHPITAFLVLYLFYIIWQAFNPEMYSILGWFNFFRRQVMIFLLYILTLHVIKSEKDVKRVFNIWLLFSIIAAAYAILTQIFRLPYFEEQWVMASKNRQNLYYLVDGFKRKYSLYSDPAAFGMDMAATTLILLIFSFFAESKSIKIQNLFLALICLLAAVYSGTRTAYLMIISGLVLFMLMRGINRNTFLIGFATLIGFIGFMKVPIYDNLFINRIRSAFHFSDDASLQVRNINRARIQPYIHSHSIGGGVYTTGGQGRDYNPEHMLAGFPPDSGYLKEALETGWIGLLVLLSLHFVILRSGIYAFFNNSNKQLKGMIVAATTALFSFVIANYGQDAFGQIPSCFLFCICIAIITKSHQLNSNSIS
ncbi:MAG: hypothetical protein RL728_1164 [Bacteroidota bacterium]|jgi:hypothetical protein